MLTCSAAGIWDKVNFDSQLQFEMHINTSMQVSQVSSLISNLKQVLIS